MSNPQKTVNLITYARFALEAIVAASGKDTDGPNSPTRRQIQNTAAEPFRHADVRARTNPNKSKASVSYPSSKNPMETFNGPRW